VTVKVGSEELMAVCEKVPQAGLVVHLIPDTTSPCAHLLARWPVYRTCRNEYVACAHTHALPCISVGGVAIVNSAFPACRKFFPAEYLWSSIFLMAGQQGTHIAAVRD
jgi:hypothetical protein